MSASRHVFAQAGEPPIPENIQVQADWPQQLIEMSAHIGPYKTLLLVEEFGGMRLYIPADWERGGRNAGKRPIREVVGDRAAQVLSAVYTREYVAVPTAKHALAAARRGPVIAAFRRGDISGNEAARTLGTSRSYFAFLANQTEEGNQVDAAPVRIGHRDPAQMDMLGDEGEA